MGDKTTISWCDFTFNPWWGCVRVSEACRNCYAESTDARNMLREGSHWGVKAPRRFFGDTHWNEPVKWNRKALEAGVRRRVFCASMGDVFEDRVDLAPHRVRLWELIRATPALDWLLLTKRPENFDVMLPWGMRLPSHQAPWSNVWLGVTAEDSEHVIDRIAILRRQPAAVRFVSCEPILELIGSEVWDEALQLGNGLGAVHWLIVGDESTSGQKGARPADPAWVRVALEAAQRHHVAFHFKQWAGRDAEGITHDLGERKGRKIHLPMLDGQRWAEFPR